MTLISSTIFFRAEEITAMYFFRRAWPRYMITKFDLMAVGEAKAGLKLRSASLPSIRLRRKPEVNSVLTAIGTKIETLLFENQHRSPADCSKIQFPDSCFHSSRFVAKLLWVSINEPPGQIFPYASIASIPVETANGCGLYSTAPDRIRDDQHFFLFDRRLCFDDLAIWGGDEALAPEWRCHLCSRVCRLRRGLSRRRCGSARRRSSRWRWRGCAGSSPRSRAAARRTRFFSLGMPADGGGVEENLARPAARSAARPSGYHWSQQMQHADLAVPRLPRSKAEVAGREIELLVEERIVRDVHLAILAEQRAVGVDDRGGVVVEARRALLEERGDDDDAVLLRELAETPRCSGRESARRARSICGPRSGRNTASGTAPACR